MPLDPRSIIQKHDSGAEVSMGDVTNTASQARFWLDTAFGLAFIRGHFTGGTSQTGMAIRVDSRLGTRHDTKLWTMQDVGTDGDADVNFRIGDSELAHWTFPAGDVLVLEWTNPNTQTWGIVAGLYPI